MVIEHLEKAWNGYVKNVWKFIGALFLFYVITGVIFLIGFLPLVYLSYTVSATPTEVFSMNMYDLSLLLFAIIMGLIALFLAATLGGGLIKMSAEALKGKTKINTMFSTAKKKFWSLVGSYFLVLIIVGILFLIFLSPVIFLLGGLPTTEMSSTLGNLKILIGIAMMFLLMIPVLLLSLFFQFALYGVVLDDKKAVESIGYSVRIVKKCYFELLALMIILAIIAGVVGSVPIIGTIVSIFVISPIAMIAYASLYLSKRKIKKKAKKRR